MKTGGRVLRIGITALLADLSLYVLWVAIPYKAIALGAGAAQLGLLPVLSSGAYVVTTLLAGVLSDRISRLRLSRIGAAIFALGCLLVMEAGSLPATFVLLPLLGLGMGFFWSPLQAAVADEGRLSSLERNIGFFNVFWSLGKALGFLIGGALYAWVGGRICFLVPAALTLLVAALLPRTRRADAGAPEGESAQAAGPDAEPTLAEWEAFGGQSLPPESGEVRRTRLRRRLMTFLPMAWIANAVAFGAGNTLGIQYPKFLLHLGHGPAAFGLYLGVVFGVQTLTFQVLRGAGGWRFRRAPSYLVQAAMALALLVIPWLHGFLPILLTAVPIGVALGFAYHASITYSLIDRGVRGRQAGIHEALLGAGNLSLPMLGGLAASGLGDLRLPYWVCAVALGVGLVAQQMIFRRGQAATGTGGS